MKTMIKRGQDIYSSQEETTSSPSSSGSEDEVRDEESNEDVYPHEESDILMVRRLLGGQSCDLSQSQRENILDLTPIGEKRKESLKRLTLTSHTSMGRTM